MTTANDLKAIFSKAVAGESFYWHCCDGHCRGAEIVWLPAAECWVFRDNDGNRETGEATELTLILSDIDGDESGLNRLGDLITVDFSGGSDLWVLDNLPEDFELPDDAEVFTIADPSEGLKVVEFVQE